MARRLVGMLIGSLGAMLKSIDHASDFDSSLGASSKWPILNLLTQIDACLNDW